MAEQFGDYTPLRRLGGGGFGTVHLAEAPDGVTVAVKVLNDWQDEVAREFFRRELEAAQLVDSRHVAQVHDHNVSGSPPWIAFRAVGTRTLMEAVRDDHAFSDVTIPALLGAARGLEAMHAAGLTHRDVSPDNVLVTPGDGMLIDLGLATLGKGTAYSKMLAGKVPYLAPEQWTTSQTHPASDVWQWGVTATKVLTGHMPFPPAENHADQMRLALEEPPNLDHIRGSKIGDLVAACLAKDPSNRPSMPRVVEELAAHLASAQEGDSNPWRPIQTHEEQVAEVVEVDVHSAGVLRVYVRTTVDAGMRTMLGWRDGDRSIGVRVGDKISVLNSERGTSQLGRVLVSLRTGAETAVSYPTTCTACGAPFDSGNVCSNERRCPPLAKQRILRHLSLAQTMHGERPDKARRQLVADVVTHLLEQRVFQDEGELYAPSVAALRTVAEGLTESAIEAFIDDWSLSKRRPFVATVSQIPGLEHHAALVAAALPSLEQLIAADAEQLLEAMIRPRSYWRRLAPAEIEADKERTRHNLRHSADAAKGWLSVTWHQDVLYAMGRAGVPMTHHAEDVWPPSLRRRPSGPERL